MKIFVPKSVFAELTDGIAATAVVERYCHIFADYALETDEVIIESDGKRLHLQIDARRCSSVG